MKKAKSFLAFLLAGLMLMSLLAGCGPSVSVEGGGSGESTATAAPADGGEAPADSGEQPAEGDASDTSYAPGTQLRMAVGYNSTSTGIAFDAEIAGSGITLADGNTYHTGDLKPTWQELVNRLNITIENKYQGNSTTKEFEFWQDRLDEVDIVSGTATLLSQYGEAGSIVNLAEHLDQMPNLKAYLDANPIVRMSITANTDTGAFYLTPYFDGVNDIEKMPLMRTDWVEKLLNGEGEFTADACNDTQDPVYEPYMPTSGTVTVDVVTADGTGVEQVTKDYDTAGNIVAKMNEAGAMSGVDAVNMLRTYIDEAYGGYYGANRADLFIGQNAAWDADELVALLRCVVANPQTLNGTDSVQGIFSRQDDDNNRRVDMFRLAAHLFGVRGMESRQDYLYIGADGAVHDARQEPETYEALERMHDMAEEGLISKAFMDMSTESSSTYLENDLGFMSYDYNQTQTILNETKLQNDEGEKYMVVMVPVALWHDGSSDEGVYMRFTESWRSVKPDGWGISAKGVGDDPDKLNAALTLLDYAYSDEGKILMSYGPDAFIKTNADGSYVTFNFNGEQMPEISDATYEELWEKASGNYTNYARQYLGACLSFIKQQSFEYQCTHEVGKEGASHISAAIGLGTIKHPELDVAENSWYTVMPTVLPTSTVDNEKLNGYSDLNTNFSTEKGGENLFLKLIIDGYTEEGLMSAEEAAETVSGTWGGAQYLAIKEAAWQSDLDFYSTLK